MTIARHRLKAVRFATDVVVSSCPDREDVLLWRVLHETKNGFFVDVGAGDPNWGSPTRWFSEQGWTGVNFEPHPQLFPTLDAWRPRDINLNAGVSDQSGDLTFYQVSPTHDGIAWGLSSFSPASAENARASGYEVTEIIVRTLRLDDMLDKHASGRVIDLLKIDVEGYEGSVLRTMDFERHRPRVLCIEATEPCTPEPSFADWEPLITSRGYTFAAFDGINNYYVRDEDGDGLLSQFNCGLTQNDRYVVARFEDMKAPWL